MSADVTASMAALAASTDSLQRSIGTLTDDQVQGPSLLPGWSRGHVLTHVARNADAMVNLATWARTGVETPMYPSREHRDTTIAVQSGRPAAELVSDVDASHCRLVQTLDELKPEHWQAPLSWGAQDRDTRAWLIPALRRTEVEVHHVDLDLDYTPAHWPEEFVEALLGEVANELTARGDGLACVLVGNDDEGRWQIGAGGPEINGPPPALLGWLLGRTDGTGVHASDGAPLPEPGRWR
ncbi:MAG: maleylpyruvate isomerase family mycothiol-dependent enzyme [Nocardioidaceae bacterium]